MRYELSLASETFTPAVEAFDRQMIVLLRRMRQQHISEGSVSLKISVSLERQFPLDENGQQQEIYVPRFEHETAAQIVQKAKTSGEINEDFVLVLGADGLPAMYSRDTDNLFDMVAEKEAGKDGEADSSNDR